MGLKLGSEGGVPRAPPPTRLVPDGQEAVAIRGGLPCAATPETDAVCTTVWAGPPVEHMAKLVTWSPVSDCPPNPPTAVQKLGSVAPLATGLPPESLGMVPLTLRPLPGVAVSAALPTSMPPPMSVVPDGHWVVALVADPAAFPMGWVAVTTWVLNPAASAGPADSHTVANTGINVATSALLALIVTLPTRNSTTALLPARPSDGPLMDDSILSSSQVSSHLTQRMSTGTTEVERFRRRDSSRQSGCSGPCLRRGNRSGARHGAPTGSLVRSASGVPCCRNGGPFRAHQWCLERNRGGMCTAPRRSGLARLCRSAARRGRQALRCRGVGDHRARHARCDQ